MIFVREEEGIVIVILVTKAQLQFEVTEINIRTSQVYPMNPVIHVICFLSLGINIQVIVLEHVFQFKTPQEGISQRIVQLHVGIHTQTSGQGKPRTSKILVSKRGIQQNSCHFL